MNSTPNETPPEVSLLMPCFNEEETILPTVTAVARVMTNLECSWELIAVNDGSRDLTLKALLAAQKQCEHLIILDLSRNFGKEAALSAGLAHCRGSAIIPLDADLQDPPELICRLLDEWRAGAEVVLARRSNRDADSPAKRISAKLFYRLINSLSDVPIPENVGDFRLMDRSVVDTLNTLPESNRFMKGLFAWVGYNTVTVDYVRPSRGYGTTKFSAWRLWNLALEGITSFSTIPLRIWTYIGALISTLGFAYAIFIITRTLAYGVDVPGYASLLTVILILGGVQLLGMGIVGEYLGRIYIESKRRPAYLVRKVFRSTP